MTENKRYEFDVMNGGGYVVGYSEIMSDDISFFTRLCEVPTKTQAEKVCNELKGLQKENEQLKERITDKNIETEIEIGKYIEKVLKVIDEENEKYWLKEKTSLRKEAKIYNSFRRSLTKIGMELF